MLLIGAAIVAVFAIVVAYPAVLANTRENAARIDANESRVERLLDAHQIEHGTPTQNGEAKE